MTMTVLPENNFGFINLSSATAEGSLLVKANQIVAIGHHQDGGVIIWTNKDAFWAKESMDQLIEQLENVHPAMR